MTTIIGVLALITLAVLVTLAALAGLAALTDGEGEREQCMELWGDDPATHDSIYGVQE